MTIYIYNSMSGRKEAFETLEPGKVRFYACGPTVYNYFHIGNARMFVVFDTVRRYLEFSGYDVNFVQNFTDVDDKIIQRANETGQDVRAVADYYIQAYFEDVEALGVRRATVHPRVTESIPEIISFIDDLIRMGYAYEADGDVYYHTSSFKDYGKLSHQSVEEMRSGFRIDVNDVKRDPSDFALWKKAKPNEEYWDSPWGPGRPGWHIECSVMNKKYLGEQIDIHAGGRDLIFPHHENEIAQSEAHSGHEFARYWMHNGTLNINGEKMSKSLGNFIMTRELLEKRPAHIVRFFLLSAHYRHPLNYTEEGLDHVQQGYDRIERCLRNLEHRKDAILELPALLQESAVSSAGDALVRADVESMRNAFVAAMNDDFNTADAISAVFEGVRQANTYLTQQQVTLAGLTTWRDGILALLDVLGIRERSTGEAGLSDAVIDALIEERKQARKNRNFTRADEIRDELAKANVILEDTAQGTRWYRG